MANPNSSFVIKHYDGFGGNFIDSQYLGASYDTGKPHMFEDTLMRIYSAQSRFFTGKPFMGMTGGKGKSNIKEIDTEIFRWRLQGAEDKSARVVELLDDSNTTPGLNNTTFRAKLDLGYFSEPDVLFSEDNEYPLAVQGEGIPDGTGFIYTFKIQGDDPSAFLDPANLQPGKQFNKVWTSVASEANDKFGTQQYTASFMLESQVSAFAEKFSVTDKAWREEGRLAVEFMYKDANGNDVKASRFLPMAEAKMWNNLYMGMEAQLTYGKKQTQPGPGKYSIKTGPGLRQQLKDSWVEYYNGPLTVNFLQDYLLDIFFSREDETNRKVTLMTGTLGSQNFHYAVQAVANGYLTVDTNWVNKIASPVETPHLAYGAQFTRYRGPEGVVIDLIKNPLYDSTMFCKRMHPLYPNKPIDSARMTILDFGTAGGENNIQMLRVKDTFRWGYVAGTHTPTGPVKGGQAGALKAGYDMFTEGTAGMFIKDITRCGEIIYDFEY